MKELAEQVGQASGLLGLLLGLVALFTSEQARRLGEQRRRSGGADRDTLRSIRIFSAALAAVTAAAVVALWPTVRDVVAAIGDPGWEPVLTVFLLAWLLLLPLTGWQVYLAVRARQRSE